VFPSPDTIRAKSAFTAVVPDDSWNSSTQTDRFRSGVRPSVVHVFIHSLSPSYTLWDFGAYRLSPPLVQDHTTGIVCDSPTTRDGTESTPTIVKFHREVPLILKNLRSLGVTVAACSRTSAPKTCVSVPSLAQCSINCIDGAFYGTARARHPGMAKKTL